MEAENIITLFENEDVYALPVDEKMDFHFGNKDFSGPLICIHNTELTDTNLSFLEKIIKAIGFELSAQCDLAVFDIEKKYSLKEILKTPSSGQTIFFGNFQNQFDLNLHLKLNEWISFGTIITLFSYNLEDLQKDKIKKQELWQSLKIKY